jgi:hypothetical protein
MARWLRPHNQQGYSCMRSQASPRKTRSKGTWGKVGKLIAWALPLMVAIAAWQTARDAAHSARDAAASARDAAASARKAIQIQEATSLLSIEPGLEVHAAFPPRILLWNNGKVDALAVTVEMMVWEGGTRPSGMPYKWAWRTQTPEWVLGDIAPSQHRIISVSPPPTQPSPALPEEIRKERHRFIELIVRYLRAADRKSYDQRSYYFVGTTGEWVSENGSHADIAFTRRIQQSIKDEGFRSRPWRLPDFDPVHVKSE